MVASLVMEHGLRGVRAQPFHGMWDLARPGFEPVYPCIGRWILNHLTTREVPSITLLMNISWNQL